MLPVPLAPDTALPLDVLFGTAFELVTLVWELLTEADDRPKDGALVVARDPLLVVALLSYCESLLEPLFNFV